MSIGDFFAFVSVFFAGATLGGLVFWCVDGRAESRCAQLERLLTGAWECAAKETRKLRHSEAVIRRLKEELADYRNQQGKE